MSKLELYKILNTSYHDLCKAEDNHISKLAAGNSIEKLHSQKQCMLHKNKL